MTKAIVYRTENKINGKFYYGVHKIRSIDTQDPWYLGSGTLLKKAIDKYGKNNFVRRTIKEFNSEEEAYDLERVIVDAVRSNPDCYNLCDGGGRPPAPLSSVIAERNVKFRHRSKAVVDNSTGKIYRTAKEAASTTNWSYPHFTDMLNGKKTNYSNMSWQRKEDMTTCE